jgi:hypothetical protein
MIPYSVMQSDVKIVTVPASEIEDWERFHTALARAFGFPDCCRRNLSARRHADRPGGGICGPMPEHSADIECAAVVNHQRAMMRQCLRWC